MDKKKQFEESLQKYKKAKDDFNYYKKHYDSYSKRWDEALAELGDDDKEVISLGKKVDFSYTKMDEAREKYYLFANTTLELYLELEENNESGTYVPPIQPHTVLKKNEMIFRINQEVEADLIKLCEKHNFIVKERKSDGSILFEGRNSERNETEKMSIGFVLLDDKILLPKITKWIWSDGSHEEDVLTMAKEKGYLTNE